MNWSQLWTITWLRWQLSHNQWKRAGTFTAILMTCTAIAMLLFGVASFFIVMIAGVMLLPKATDFHVWMAWDVLVGIFLFWWLLALLTEIQRSEFLSFDKLLHLPVSLAGAFGLNYLTSWISLTILWFVPTCCGFIIALTITRGPRMLLLFPILLSFLFLVTAVTYQLRGWLASLMANKRRRGSIIAIFSLGIVVLSQAPHLAMQVFFRHPKDEQLRAKAVQLERKQAIAELTIELTEHRIDKQKYDTKLSEINQTSVQNAKLATEDNWEVMERYLILGHRIVPVAWLPYASRELIQGRLFSTGLCLLGMTLIGSASLWRAYHSTMRYYTGQTGSLPRKAPQGIAISKSPGEQRWMERQITNMRESTSTVALASFLNLLRAPEAKMALIAPIVIGCMFSVIMLSHGLPKLPVGSEAFLMLSGLAIVTLMMLTIQTNTFGIDRGGFRAYILMPIERRDILVGKNLAILPVSIVFACVLTLASFYFASPPFTHVIATILQWIVVFCSTSIAGNWMSILCPAAMTAGTIKPAQPNFTLVIANMIVILLSPMIFLPAAIGIGGDMAIKHFTSFNLSLVYLVVSVFESIAAVWLYARILDKQGKLLQARETKILEALMSNSE